MMMDIPNRRDLEALVQADTSSKVTLTMPTYRAGREVRQNAIRYKNLVRAAEQGLKAAECPEEQASTILKKLNKLCDNEEWWQHQADGLIVYASNDSWKAYRVPLDLEELVVAGPRYQVRSLIRLLQDDGRFYLLAASQNNVQLYLGSQYQIMELEPDELPGDLRSALNIDEYVSSLQYHTAGAATGRDEAIYHGHGGSDPDVRKQDEILQYFRRVDAALQHVLDPPSTPLVFAGVEYLFPIYRKASDSAGLVDRPVGGNPEQMDPEALHREAWKVVEPVFKSRRTEALDQWNERRASDRAADDLEQILRAADYGLVDTLLLKQGAKAWGMPDKEGGWERIEREEPGAEDLVNLAAARTLAKGGRVFACEPDALPEIQEVAALLRSPLPDAAPNR